MASTAPFVGLFGTVWGVYHALAAIGMSGSGSLDKVAGPVGEALIMTGVGLAVAIPAVVGYNALSRGNRQLAAEHGLHTERARHFSNALGRVLGGREIDVRVEIGRAQCALGHLAERGVLGRSRRRLIGAGRLIGLPCLRPLLISVAVRQVRIRRPEVGLQIGLHIAVALREVGTTGLIGRSQPVGRKDIRGAADKLGEVGDALEHADAKVLGHVGAEFEGGRLRLGLRLIKLVECVGLGLHGAGGGGGLIAAHRDLHRAGGLRLLIEFVECIGHRRSPSEHIPRHIATVTILLVEVGG